MFDFLKRLFNQPVFEVRFKAGEGKLFKGKVTRAFIQECLEVCKMEGLDSISIYGVNSDNGIRLEFSSNIPKSSCQKFRNIWELYR